MKRVETICILILSIAEITACAPLQQAPLVYSSKQSLGIDFSTATTEQPGLALNLGFKSVDAAYVPVAVAKPCDIPKQDVNSAIQGANATESDCSSKVYALHEIKGGKDDRDSNIPRETVENAQKLLSDFSAANATKKSADAAVNDASTNLEKLKAQLKDKKDTLTQISGTLPAFTQKIQSAEESPPTDDKGKAALAAAQQSVKEANDRIAELNKQIPEMDKLVQAASDDLLKKKDAATLAQTAFDKIELSKLADALKIVVTASSVKSDAYSVFGSFGANTTFGTTGSVAGAANNAGTAGGANAGIAIGKIFSTGVASQNLTEGIQEYYKNMALAQVMQAKSTYNDCLKATPARLKQIGLPDDMSKATAQEKQKAEDAYNDCLKNDVTINLPVGTPKPRER